MSSHTYVCKSTIPAPIPPFVLLFPSRRLPTPHMTTTVLYIAFNRSFTTDTWCNVLPSLSVSSSSPSEVIDGQQVARVERLATKRALGLGREGR